jgi:uncharacterized protein YbbC (DUF1343 family)
MEKLTTAEMLNVTRCFRYAGRARFTYLSTLYYAIRGAAQAGKPRIVLDRPNPIGGTIVEGPVLQPGFESFVGIAQLPIRYALTLGEAALLMNQEYHLGAELQVISLQGWKRAMWYDETGLPWVPPSPAMPHLSTASVYPGTCLLEGTNLSEGRGPTCPSRYAEHPDDVGRWLPASDLELQGVGSTQQPSNHPAQICRETQRVQLHVTDRQAFRPVRTVMHLLSVIHALYPEKLTWNAHFDRLAGNSQVRKGIQEGRPAEEIIASWEVALTQFDTTRKKYLLYG